MSWTSFEVVVSYRNSTSNHNDEFPIIVDNALYLIEILHQTTTLPLCFSRFSRLYLIEILHQTTTQTLPVIWHIGCILSKFYIKPQQIWHTVKYYRVVSYRNSTSNHNRPNINRKVSTVVSYRNSTSNHNGKCIECRQKKVVSYRNSTSNHNRELCFRLVCSCILSKFYIKPQPLGIPFAHRRVVSYRNSTSNHNYSQYRVGVSHVVSYRNSTSNHNTYHPRGPSRQLYLIEILHQTTTCSLRTWLNRCCILSKFYIKPQLHGGQSAIDSSCILSKFYIKPQR